MSSKLKQPRVKASASGASAKPRSILSIGVTGHRRHRLKVPDGILMQRVFDVIRSLQSVGNFENADSIQIISALAEGADEIVARVALNTGCRLTALLPFELKDYESTFSDSKHKSVFRHLMKEADAQIILPGSLRRANAGYVAVGVETLARSDVVLTVWDGAPAQGRGGTPEILQTALVRRLPIIWIDARTNRAPRLLHRKTFGPCPRLENIAMRAKPLRNRDLAEVL